MTHNGYPVATQTVPPPPEPTHDPTNVTGFSQRSSQTTSSDPFSRGSGSISFASPADAMFISRFSSDRDSSSQATDKRSSVDPRRFTSDLDNSLIQQIHTLRLELDSKNTLVDSLEDSLQRSKTENGQLSEDLSVQATEARSLRKQMQLLENGTLSALGDMAKERDSAVEAMTESRRRLDASKKKLKTQEEEAERMQMVREKEQQHWQSERRGLEQNVHVMESRIKTMVAEMVGLESQRRPSTDAPLRSQSRADSRATVRADSRLSMRSDDDAKEPPVRAPSRLAALYEGGGSKSSSVSLAEELENEESEAEDYHHHINAAQEERELKRSRYSEDEKARKMMGLLPERSESAMSGEGQSMGIIMDYMHTARNSAVHYVEKATQFTPPQSPMQSPTLPLQRPSSMWSQDSEQFGEVAANQRRKRITIPPLFLEQAPAKPGHRKAPSMATTSSQTEEVEASQPVPSAPMSNASSQTLAVEPEPVAVETFDACTQTDDKEPSRRSSTPAFLNPGSIDVPFIAIHPPSSRPPSAHTSVMLPPRTKNAACQVTVDLAIDTKTVATQTEERPLSQRPMSIPILPPLAFSMESLRDIKRKSRSSAGSRPTSLPKRASWSSSLDRVPFGYPGRNDDGPLNEVDEFAPRRPVRSNSLFAGFSDEEVEDVAAEYSEDDFASVAPIRKTLSKVKDSWRLIAQESGLEPVDSASDPELPVRAGRSVADQVIENAEAQAIKMGKLSHSRKHVPAPLKMNPVKQIDFRRTALVSSGSSAHVQRSRSPSEPTIDEHGVAIITPPFPVPTRSSSRKIPLSASDGASSPSPYSTTFFSAQKNEEPKPRPPVKRKILRKVQSASAAVTRPAAPTRPPPPPPPAASAGQASAAASNPPSTPTKTKASPNQFILPYPNEAEELKHAEEARVSQAAESTTSAPNAQNTSVVDAIAQTMVGEWMWKYVRKRSSFGLPEDGDGGKGGEGGVGGARHKRWVWLAPYERAVIWSSKQPTSGPALLGKGGRKLSIQSVLDVKDDSPLPKGSTSDTVFDRSILILTPERALKFTAVSRERHYIWLTALSFLSASSQGMADLETQPAGSQASTGNLTRPPSRDLSTGLRRSIARDSWRASRASSRPSVGVHSLSSPPGELDLLGPVSFDALMPQNAVDEEAAEAPQIPRTSAHTRKRSSTGPRPLPPALSNLHAHLADSMALASSIDLHHGASSSTVFHPSASASAANVSVAAPPPPTARDRYESSYNNQSTTSLFRPSLGPSSYSQPAGFGSLSVSSIASTHDIHNGGGSNNASTVFDPAGGSSGSSTMRMAAFVDDSRTRQQPNHSNNSNSNSHPSRDRSHGQGHEQDRSKRRVASDRPFARPPEYNTYNNYNAASRRSSRSRQASNSGTTSMASGYGNGNGYGRGGASSSSLRGVAGQDDPFRGF